MPLNSPFLFFLENFYPFRPEKAFLLSVFLAFSFLFFFFLSKGAVFFAGSELFSFLF